MRYARLLPHLHRVFDLYPGPALALRVNGGASELVWDITGDTLRIQAGDGLVYTVNLAQYTLAGLADFLAVLGFTVAYENGDLGNLSAAALVPGPNRVVFTE